MQVMEITYFIYLLAAAWLDLKKRRIPVWLFAAFGAVGILEHIRWGGTGWAETAAAMLPGLVLLLLTRCCGGGIGAGDGYFFLVSAVYLGFRNTIAVFCCGLLFCSVCCLFIVAWGAMTGVSVRKKKLPFLPFMLPAWAWVVLL